MARLRAKGVEVTFAPCAPLTNAILIDGSKDGGAWWFPQPDGNFDASEPHQGKALADFLRSQGNEVVEVGRGVEITNELLGSFNKVIRAGVFGAYTGSELAAYDQYILRSDAHLLLTTALLSGGAVDPISESIGLPMAGSHTGTMSPVGSTAITQGVGPLTYSPPGAVVGPAPTAAITPLGILGNGSVVMGLVTSEPAQILFMGNLLLLEGLLLGGVPQPLVSNLLSWLFSAPGGEGPIMEPVAGNFGIGAGNSGESTIQENLSLQPFGSFSETVASGLATSQLDVSVSPKLQKGSKHFLK